MNTVSKQKTTITGKVVSNKMNKSVVVLVDRRVRDPRYGKYKTLSSKMHAHDENNECNIGDIVKIQETRPYSKTKTWKVVEIVQAGTEN